MRNVTTKQGDSFPFDSLTIGHFPKSGFARERMMGETEARGVMTMIFMYWLEGIVVHTYQKEYIGTVDLTRTAVAH